MDFRAGSSSIDWLMKIRGIVPRPLRRHALLKSRLLLRLIGYESVMDAAGLNDMGELLDMTLHVPGGIVECGCNRCGTTVIIANHLRSRSVRKTIYACDTFHGFAVAELDRERKLGRADAPPSAFAGPGQYEYVKEKLFRLGVDDQVVPIKGFFQDTFPRWLMVWRDLSLVFVDCDLEDSTLFCARALWPLLAPGGVMAFDDYTSPQFKGARIAIDRFVAEGPRELGPHNLMRRLYVLRKQALATKAVTQQCCGIT
jgi:Macrocin-O-methyltransferase (TylF)